MFELTSLSQEEGPSKSQLYAPRRMPELQEVGSVVSSVVLISYYFHQIEILNREVTEQNT